MIVRINQFEIVKADRRAGWPLDGLQGPVDYAWPADSRALEILILPTDENQVPLDLAFRRGQLRGLIPRIVEALREPREQIVARIDGPVVTGEILGGYRYVTNGDGRGRFSISAAQKLDEDPIPAIASARMHLSPHRLSELCADPSIGLERTTRLRIYAVPEAMVSPLLDTADPDDERWGEILPTSAFVLSTVHELASVQVITRRYTTDHARARMLRQFTGTLGARNL